MTPELWKTYRQPMADELMESHWAAQAIRVMARDLPGGPTLCVGCGDGTELDLIPESVGVTLNVGNIRGRRNVVQADMHCLPFPAKRFAGVFCKDTFEHALAPTIVFAEFARVAREWIYLAIPEEGWDYSPHHPVILTERQLATMAQKAGWSTAHSQMRMRQDWEGKPLTWLMDCYLMRPV